MRFLAFVVFCLTSNVLAHDYFHSLYLDRNKTYHLSWKFNNSHIEFHIKVKTLGYVALGLSMEGSLKNADVFFAGVSNGQSYSSNYYGNADEKLSPQATSEWHLLYFNESDMMTTLTFSRELSGPNMKINITQNTMRVLWGYNKTDEVSDNFQPDGVQSLYLLQSKLPDPVMPNDTIEIEFRMNNTLIPKSKTTYWCKSFKLPPFDEQVHGIVVSPYVQEGNEAFVHHVILYSCDNKQNSGGNDTGYDGICESKNMPPDFKYCLTMVHAWAVGGSEFILPEHVGIPFGGKEDPVYYVMEMHYDNPQEKEGVLDSSGFKITATKTKRKYEVGNLGVGCLVGYHPEIMPPYAKQFKYKGYCEACGSMIKPEKNTQWKEEGVKMIATLLHGHLLARKIRLHHYRNNKMLTDIAYDDNYDFNYQETRVLEKEITLLKGDSLELECIYDTSQRTNFTYGGPSTFDEMCMAFISLYPRIELKNCLSETDYNISLIKMDPLHYKNNQDAIKEMELIVNGMEPKVGFKQFCITNSDLVVFNNRSLPLIKSDDPSTVPQTTTIKNSAANFFTWNALILILHFYWLI